MRLYIKLSLFVLAFVGIQRGIDSAHDQVQHAVFTIRCGIAFAARDHQMIDQLAWEVHRRDWQRAER